MSSDHIVTGAFNIIDNISLRDALTKGSKYSEPKSISWKNSFKIRMYSVEDYVRRWTKREKKTYILFPESVDLDLLRLDWYVMKNIA
jgi:hypothetical protein